MLNLFNFVRITEIFVFFNVFENSVSTNEGRKEGNVCFNDALNTFNYGYMASHIW